MNFKRNTKNILDLFTLRGSFALPSGELSAAADGYEFIGEDYSLKSVFTPHPSGVIERRDTITNTSGKTLSLRSVLSKFTFNGGEYEVYTQYSIWCGERYGKWQPLVSEISASNDDIRMNAGSSPFVALYSLQNNRGMAFHILCDSKWCFKVKNAYNQIGQRKTVCVELGIDDRGLDMKLAPNESLSLPAILFYSFVNKTDMDAYKLHRYCNDVFPKRSLPIIYNSWMSNFDEISFDILSLQLERAKRIGTEYFVIDAGWFGAPHKWFDLVGDWEEYTEGSMAGRMREFADKVRAEGLKFGLWFEIERASLSSRAYASHPEHYIVEGNSAFVNFADENACEYIFDILCSQIDKYDIEFIKFDFNDVLSSDPSGRAFIDYFAGYRRFIRRIKERYPSIYIQNCASGGMRMALANARDVDSFWMSDDHSLYSQLEIFKHAVIRMPSNFLEKWITIRSFEGFTPVYDGGEVEKILMSGDAGWDHVEAVYESYLNAIALGGPLCVSCDLTKLSDSLLEKLSALIAGYRAERDFWAQSECRILTDTDSLTVLEFSDKSFDQIELLTFSALPVQNSVTIYPAVKDGAIYECPCACRMSAEELTADGIEVGIGRRSTASRTTLRRIK